MCPSDLSHGISERWPELSESKLQAGPYNGSHPINTTFSDTLRVHASDKLSFKLSQEKGRLKIIIIMMGGHMRNAWAFMFNRLPEPSRLVCSRRRFVNLQAIILTPNMHVHMVLLLIIDLLYRSIYFLMKQLYRWARSAQEHDNDFTYWAFIARSYQHHITPTFSVHTIYSQSSWSWSSHIRTCEKW